MRLIHKSGKIELNNGSFGKDFTQRPLTSSRPLQEDLRSNWEIGLVGLELKGGGLVECV